MKTIAPIAAAIGILLAFFLAIIYIPDEVKHAIVTGFTILLMLFFLYMFFCSVFSPFAEAAARTKEEKEKKTYKITPGRIFALIMAIVAIAFAITTIINGNLH